MSEHFPNFGSFPHRIRWIFMYGRLSILAPPASRFELILKESGGETVVLLLDRAKTTRQYFTSVAILRYLAALPVEYMKYIQRAKVDSAIENCLSLEGSSAQSICKDDGSELRKRLIAE